MKDLNKHVWAPLLTLLCTTSGVICFNCNIEGYDLTPLNRTWTARSDASSDLNVTYQISLCSALKSDGTHGCHANTAICMTFANGTSLSIGNFSEKNISGAENKAIGEVWVFYSGDQCPEFHYSNLTTSINLKCGPTMGSPKFLDYSFCTSYFEWESNVYCKDEKPVEEVPCYLYDESGSRYDLSHLAKKKGGYLVSSEMTTDVYINVCRDINMGTTGQGCPSGHGGYRKTGANCIGLGKPKDGLQQSARGLTMKYVSDSTYKPSGCTTPPSTTITFICPKRGGSKDPLVIQDFDCQYDIEWETEYACPEAKLSNNTCRLTKEDADIDIDLTPLRQQTGTSNPYKVNFTDSSGITYEYWLNVCGELSLGCPQRGKIPACQTKPSESDFTAKMGSLDHMTLRYADGDLTLIYKGGAVCSNNFQRQTIIEFVCDPDAGHNGTGYPEYENEENCTYTFSWKTKYACLDHPVGEECRVNNNGKRYDLSSLVRTHGTNWLALGQVLAAGGEYYINVCHNVLQTEEAARCDPGAAVCYRDASGSINLGRYEQAPTFDNATSNIKIQYTNGDVCVGTKRKSSTITFKCRPGDSDSAPTLTYVSFDECMYEFDWWTSAACVLGAYVGTHCKVFDKESGFNFDINPLMKSGPPYYKVDPGASDDHEYLLNVCGPVTGTSCNTMTGETFDVSKTGICQQPKQGKTGSTYVAGQYSTDLHYFDGMINLTYAGGSHYHDDKQTPRKSEITFLCDPAAGAGSPTFFAEVTSDHYYGFEWRTAYACPNQPMECSAVDIKTGDQYDLSRLSVEGGYQNWAVESADGKTKYYISVCQALKKVNVDNGCGALASVCRTRITAGQAESMDIPNLGQVKSGITVVEKGHLRLVYEGPKTCNNRSQIVPYRTTIDFVCMQGQEISRPGTPVQAGQCEYTVTWVTAHACPIGSDTVTADPCTVKDPNSDYIFNLQPLMKQGTDAYSVTVGATEYKLSICGNLSTSICDTIDNNPAAMCSVVGGTKTSYVMGLHYQLDFNEAGLMALTYHGLRKQSGQRTQVQINFECDPSIDLGQPEFVGHDDAIYIFTFKTSLACKPMGMDCFVQDENGNEYDLGSLARKDGWPALDTRDDKTKYYINVCQSINNINGSNCPDGPIGGCQVASNSHSYNMGYIQSQPIAHSDGTLTIHYRNGDICHKGKPNESHRSTRINFYCNYVEGGPVFQSETATCEYTFNWITPAACKLTRAVGHDCKVIEPRYGYVYDLNPLRRNTSDYHAKFEAYDYMINVCGPLVETGFCNLSTGVGACQTKPGATFTPVHAGKANSELKYSSGELTMTYSNGKAKCHGKYTRKTVITFVCNHLESGLSGPVFIKETDNCQYQFVWTTRYACPPHRMMPCSYTDPQGNIYDLSSLARHDDNYDYTDTFNKTRYLINVCTTVIHKHDAMCPYYAAACKVDLTKADSDVTKYINIGSYNVEFTKDGGKLILIYNSGSSCANGKDHTTMIRFICDPSAKDTDPTGHFLTDDCVHHFLWRTAAACPIKKSTPAPSTSNITCKVTDDVTGTQIDLSPLIAVDSPWNVKDSNDHLYEFNICAPLKTSKCTNTSANIGVCASEIGGAKRTYNAGNVVHDVRFDDGVVVYTLTGGDRCHGGKFERTTIINFVCNGNKGLGRPVFIDESEDCTYYIAWHTNLVCENEVKCSVDTDDFHTLDLSPLARNPDNIVQSARANATYYLSVCQPLQPVPGTRCPSGASSCEVKDDKSALSLGKPKSPPTFGKTSGDVTLTYTNGSKCDVDPKKNFTTVITFNCQPGPVRSNPVLLDKVGCYYLFQWPTYTVCYDMEPQKASDVCGYKDRWSNMFYNFTLLRKSTPWEVNHMNTKYLINMCGSVTTKKSCGTSMVCRDSDGLSFGEPHDFRADHDSRMIKLTYRAGGKCKDGTAASSQILFQCDRKADINQPPEYLTGSSCKVQFLWKTNVVCPPISTQCTLADGSSLYDMSLLTRDAGAWNLTDSSGNTYWINVCGPLDRSVGGGSCGHNSGACRRTKDGRVDNLGEVTSLTRPYKDAKTGAIVLEYKQGGAACTHGRSRSEFDAARTKINFICGTTYGGPKYVKSNEDCLFEFKWVTKLACAVKRGEVEMKDGKIIDPRSGGTINLNSILNTQFEVSLEDGSGPAYYIQLDGNSSYCVDGVVCDIQDKKHPHLLGTHKSVKFFVDDDLLEAVYTSPEKCADTSQPNKNVTSVIHFHCRKTQKVPELLYKSKDCMFVFDWETPVACQEAQVIIPAPGGSTPGSGSGSSGPGSKSGTKGVSGKTVAAIVGVFTTAILVCILLVVFHKQERRAAFLGGVRRVFRLKSSEYTQLPTDAADDLQGEEDILTFSDPADTETNREEDNLVSVTTTPSYHDDSDEDLLA